MNLSEGIRLYVQHKRSIGVGFSKAEKTFAGFCREIGDCSLATVQTSDVLRYIDRPETSNVTYRHKHSEFRYLFEFLEARGFMPELAMPPNRPPVRQTFTPYIYTKEEIRCILAASRYRSKWAFNVTVAPQTMRMLILALYGTGALLSEVLDLRAENVCLSKGLIIIKSHRFGRTRKLPLSTDLTLAMRRYERWKCRQGILSEFFLCQENGTPLRARTVGGIFQRIRNRAGISRTDGAIYQPRMHDLRSTFAVHRITSWVKNQADLNKMLPALAVYMGQSGLASTERYFFLTPERFRRDLERLLPSKRHKRWRENPKLIAYLSHL